MPFKMVTLSEKEVGRIAGHAGKHAERMAKVFTARWRKNLPKGQKVIDIQQLQMCVRQDLHGLRGEIREIEHEHLDQLELDRLSRDVRDVSIPQLRGGLVGIERLFNGAYGPGSSTKVFGEETLAIPTDPFPLLRVARRAHRRLMAPDLVLPTVQLGGVQVTPTELAKGFEAPMWKLDEALAGLEESVPETSATLEAKIRKLDELQKQVGIAARFLEALYYLAGHDEIAKRVRPSSHRSRVANDGVAGDEPAASDSAVSETAVEAGESAGEADVTVVVEEAAEAA